MDERIGRNILKIGRQSEYNNPKQWKAKHVLPFQWWEIYLGLHFSSSSSTFFLCERFLIAAQAHKYFFYFEWRWIRWISTMVSKEKDVQWWRWPPRLRMGFWHGSPIGLLSYFIVKFPFRHIFKGSHIFSFQFMVGHQENKNLLGDFQRVFTTCPRRLLVIASWILLNSCFSGLIYFKDVSELQSLRRREVHSLQWF